MTTTTTKPGDPQGAPMGAPLSAPLDTALDERRDPERPAYWLEEVYTKHVPENDLEMALEDLGMAVFATETEQDRESIRERVRAEAAAVEQDMSGLGDATKVILEMELEVIIGQDKADREAIRMKRASAREKLEPHPRQQQRKRRKTRPSDLKMSERMAARDKD